MSETSHTLAPGTLPIQMTPFVGRQKELAELNQMLASPGCRLLTLIGPGGVGKTRLAVEVAAQQEVARQEVAMAQQEVAAQHPVAMGVFFIDLQPLASEDQLLSAVANGLGRPLSGREEPLQQLSTFLHDKNALLLLDNFEHLADAAWQIGSLLQNTAGVKFLVTSREALNLLGECHYPVSGMPVAAQVNAQEDGVSGAVELFTACARRARPNFVLQAEVEGVLEICRLVDGFPLAIEMAASWARMMSCAEIAQEIIRSTQFLTTSASNVPERHRSVQVIFRQTFERLTQVEKDALRRLAVFQGGFRREAAQGVAGASLVVLSVLVDKSLLKCLPNGRYQIHELLRQCSEEELKREPEMLETVRALHSACFTQMLRENENRLLRAAQADVLADLMEEEQNFTRAWLWAAENGRAGEISAAINTVELYYQYQSRFLEGTRLLEKTADLIDKHPPTPEMKKTLAALLNAFSWFAIRLGDYARARQSAQRSLELFDSAGAYPTPGIATHPKATLAVLEQIAGRYDRAAALSREVIEITSARGDAMNLAVGHYILAGSLLPAGAPEDAYTQAGLAYQQAKSMELRWFMSYCLIELGEAAQVLGRYEEARLHFEACYAVRDALDDPEGKAVALNHLGAVALAMNEIEQAQHNFRESLAIYKKIDDPGGLVTALNGLSACSVKTRKFAEAQVYARDALRIAAEMNYVTIIHSILVNAAAIFLRTGREQTAADVLRFIEQQAGAAHDIRQFARQMLEELGQPMPGGQPGADLQTVTVVVQQQLAIPPGIQQVPAAHAAGSLAAFNDGIEPLTEREIEVLRCLSSGLTNQEIARQLYLSVGTVKWYTSQIYAKMGVKNRARAVALARQMKLIPDIV